VNSYISYFVFAFWAKSFATLIYNLATIMIIKQLVSSILEYLYYVLAFGLKIKKVQRLYDDDIAALNKDTSGDLMKISSEKCLKMMHQDIEK